jgi:hypothetical protein
MHTLHLLVYVDDMHLRAGWHVLPPMQLSTRRTQHTNTVQKPLSEPIHTHIHTDQQQESSCTAVTPAPLLASQECTQKPAQALKTQQQAENSQHQQERRAGNGTTAAAAALLKNLPPQKANPQARQKSI